MINVLCPGYDLLNRKRLTGQLLDEANKSVDLLIEQRKLQSSPLRQIAGHIPVLIQLLLILGCSVHYINFLGREITKKCP